MDLVAKKYKEKIGAGHLNSLECVDIICKLTNLYPMTTIIIDGLDEAPKEMRSDLLTDLHEIMTHSLSLVKVFVASRSEPDVKLRFEDFEKEGISSSLRIGIDDNSEDIQRFVNERLAEDIKTHRLLPGTGVTEDLKKKIASTLISKAQGMFRWVQLSLQALCDEATEGGVLKRLGQLPQKLDELYKIIFDTIMARQEDDQVIVRRTLNWLLYSQGRLSACGFLEAIATNNSGCEGKIHKDTLLGLCRNLVEWDEQVDKFRFAHLSVQEFLVKRDDFKACQGHCLIAETCWAVLNSHLAEDLSSYKAHQEGNLVRYAVNYFPIHCQLGSSSGDSIKHILNSFLSTEGSPIFDKWIKSLAILKEERILEEIPGPSNENVHTPLSDTISSPPNPLFAISIWGFAGNLGDLSHLDETSINQANSDGKSLLCISCEYDRGEITKEIIARMKSLGCSIDTPSPRGYTALHSASQYGSADIVQLLLDERLDVNAYTTERFSKTDPWPPVINLLSGDQDSGISFVIQDRVTPLHLASRNGHLEIVKRLLAESALVNAMSMVDQSSFHFGSLVANEGSIHLHYDGGLSALHCAAGEGHEEVVRMLLLAGADVNDRRYQPEFNAATLRIGTLITNDGSIHISVKGGMDPLSWAIQTGNLKIAELIFKYKGMSKVGIDLRDTWVSLEVGTILVNSGSVHVGSEARVEIGNLLVNDGSTHLQLLEATIAKVVNNNGSIHINCSAATINDIINSQGSIHIQHQQAVTLEHSPDRAKFRALEDYVAKLATGPGSIVPQLQYGVSWNSGSLHVRFPEIQSPNTDASSEASSSET